MRTSLLPSAVRSACYNLNRKNYQGRLFEFAKVYNPKSLPLNELPVENETLSLVVFGEKEDSESILWTQNQDMLFLIKEFIIHDMSV